MKSLQLSLNTFIPKLKLPSQTVTAMAYSKARVKLRHTAFIELNRTAVVQTMYEDGDYQTLHGLRILAVDGSKVLLPFNPATVEAFGTIAYHNKLAGAQGEHCYARVSVLYDVLNKVALDAQLLPCATSEVKLAKLHLPHISRNDLVIYDRNYAGYRMLAMAHMAQGEFLIRCSRGSFQVAREMFTGHGPDDRTVTLTPNDHVRSDPDSKDMPPGLRVRFIRVTLKTGEHEVLATSLLDTERYPHAIFLELYGYRWDIETFYGKLKTRLGLENFSGLSVEAVCQDFHIAVLLTGVETIFTEDAAVLLGRQTGGHPKQVNKAVSFNVIKQRAFELFISLEPPEAVLEQLTELFVMNPVLVRPHRKPPRGRKSPAAQLHFVRRRRKMVF